MSVPTAPRTMLAWRPATVARVRAESPRTRTLWLDVDGWDGHRAGQHVDLRLTAEDGYQAARSYSIASAPVEPLSVTVDRLPDGEVSPYLVDVAEPGDQLEVRGPVGGYFVWEPSPERRPLLLVGGGSGVVPLRSMLRHRTRLGDATPLRLLASARTAEEVLYADELLAVQPPGVEVTVTLTRGTPPPGWAGATGRVDAALLSRVAWPPDDGAAAYVCGPTGFVETVASLLVASGYDPRDVRTERFGAS